MVRIHSPHDTYPCRVAFEVQLNVILLFLVSIEPFLFNELNSKVLPTEYVSVLYALDLAGLFIIQAFLANIIVSNKLRPADVLRRYRIVRNADVLVVGIFLISILPVFWTTVISINNEVGIPVRFILWIVPLFLRLIRRFWEKIVK
jgi:hypothetical protein